MSEEKQEEAVEAEPNCYQCGTVVSSFHCARCYWARYCCKEHQVKHWHFHKAQCYPLDRALVLDKKNVMLREAFKLNLFAEYKAVESKTELDKPQQGKAHTVNFHGARYYLFRGIVGMILADPINASIKEAEASEEELKVWKGFEKSILTSYYWMESLYPGSMWQKDAIHWSFIPASLHKVIERVCKLD